MLTLRGGNCGAGVRYTASVQPDSKVEHASWEQCGLVISASQRVPRQSVPTLGLNLPAHGVTILCAFVCVACLASSALLYG